jgi:hypothetical protein
MSQILEEELQEISNLRIKLATVVNDAGQVSLQIQLLERDLEDLKKTLIEQTNTFKQLLEEEQTLVTRLSEKYGTGSINFETGEFTPER